MTLLFIRTPLSAVRVRVTCGSIRLIQPTKGRELRRDRAYDLQLGLALALGLRLALALAVGVRVRIRVSVSVRVRIRVRVGVRNKG